MMPFPSFSSHSTCHTRTGGFTLVELAISMTVIGFLIAAIVQGQELIDNARATSAARQITEYNAAALTFRTTYGYLPGDITDPLDRLPNCNSTTHCATGGNGNDYVRQYDTTPVNIEIFNFFPHLTRAGLVPGFKGGNIATGDDNLYSFRSDPIDMTKDYFPRVLKFEIVPYTYPVSTAMYPETGNYFRLPGLHWHKNTLAVKYMMLIDQKLDDGVPNTGTIFITRPPSGNWASVCPGSVYVIKTRSSNCWFTIKADF